MEDYDPIIRESDIENTDTKEYAVVAAGVYKSYNIMTSTVKKIQSLFARSVKAKTFTALSDVSFKIQKGEIVGFIGLNGSGKSTLANMIAGITWPSEGTLETYGEVSLLGVNSGLDKRLTGIQNIELKGLLMGFDQKRIDSIKQNIIDFADIGQFINQPLRTYSSGMRSRLGFAIAISVEPDVLIVDEALSVGDTAFTEKCFSKMQEIRGSGKTIIFVSHSLAQVQDFCEKVMWLHKGNIMAYGDKNTVMPEYKSFIDEQRRKRKRKAPPL